MTHEWPLVVAATLGLVNAAHCIGMCGVFAVRAAAGQRSGLRTASYLLGKTFTYAFLGALAGAAGDSLAATGEPMRLALGWSLAAGLVVAGARRLMGPRGPTRWSAGLSRTLAPIVRSVPTDGGPFALGAVTGLLPCGVVYLAALGAAAQASALGGVLFMAAFAVGTAPALVAAGWLGRSVAARLSPLAARRWSAAVLIAAGLLTATRLGLLGGGGEPGCLTCSS